MSGKTRLFTVEYDNSKMPLSNPETRYGKKVHEGVHFANGLVVIDLGAMYETMTEFEHQLEWHGKYTLTYQDEEVVVEQQQSA